MKSSNIISLIKKNKNRQYLVKFYRGECLGSPHTGYGGVILCNLLIIIIIIIIIVIIILLIIVIIIIIVIIMFYPLEGSQS